MALVLQYQSYMYRYSMQKYHCIEYSNRCVICQYCVLVLLNHIQHSFRVIKQYLPSSKKLNF